MVMFIWTILVYGFLFGFGNYILDSVNKEFNVKPSLLEYSIYNMLCVLFIFPMPYGGYF